MRLLLTGAGGQLGRALPGVLGAHELVALSRSELDIRDIAAVRAAVARHRPQLVINAAAYNAVDAAEADPAAAHAVNEAGPRNLAQAAALAGAAVLHVSTDYVFDGESGAPYDEQAVPNPRSAYGRSKLAGERAVAAANPRHYVVRTAWLYAARGRNFPLTMLEQARRGPLRVVHDQTGSPTYAPHLAQAIAGLLEEQAPYGIYHLAGAGAATWYELAVALFERMGVAADLTPVRTDEFPRPAQRPRYSVLVTARQPSRVLPPWRDGLDAFAAELRGG